MFDLNLAFNSPSRVPASFTYGDWTTTRHVLPEEGTTRLTFEGTEVEMKIIVPNDLHQSTSAIQDWVLLQVCLWSDLDSWPPDSLILRLWFCVCVSVICWSFLSARPKNEVMVFPLFILIYGYHRICTIVYITLIRYHISNPPSYVRSDSGSPPLARSLRLWFLDPFLLSRCVYSFALLYRFGIGFSSSVNFSSENMYAFFCIAE